MTKELSQRIKPLDGLRGMAVVAVIAFHYLNNQLEGSAWAGEQFGTFARLLEKGTYFGWAGVNLFFILSGFLIGNILLSNRGSGNFYKTFYIRRFCRIIPAYYLLLVIYLLVSHSNWYTPDAYIFGFPLPVPSYFLFVQNFYMASQNTFGPQALTPTWSLCVEEQFYLVVPMLVAFVKPKYLWIAVVLGCLVALYSRYLSVNFYQGYVLLPSRLDSPMIGFLLAMLHQKEGFRTWMSGHLSTIYGLLVAMVIFCGAAYAFSDPGIFSHFLLAIIFALVVAIGLYSKDGLFVRFFSAPLLVYIGKLSYFVYLFHQLINGLLHLVVLKQLKPMILGYSSIWMTLLALVITFVLAEISFRYFESPIIRFSHRFRYAKPVEAVTPAL